MATTKKIPGVTKKGIPVKFARKNGIVVRGKTCSTLIQEANGPWINVKDDLGGLHKKRPSELTVV